MIKSAEWSYLWAIGYLFTVVLMKDNCRGYIINALSWKLMAWNVGQLLLWNIACNKLSLELYLCVKQEKKNSQVTNINVDSSRFVTPVEPIWNQRYWTHLICEPWSYTDILTILCRYSVQPKHLNCLPNIVSIFSCYLTYQNVNYARPLKMSCGVRQQHVSSTAIEFRKVWCGVFTDHNCFAQRIPQILNLIEVWGCQVNTLKLLSCSSNHSWTMFAVWNTMAMNGDMWKSANQTIKLTRVTWMAVAMF